LKISHKIGDDFDDFDVLDWYKKDTNNDLDFNDLHIAFIVDKNNLKLLTNDSDFGNFGINTNWYLPSAM
jgi:predicted nucleic acid-binding protein